MAYYLGIDLGTTGTKAMLYSPSGVLIGEAYSGYGVECPVPGWTEQDPEDWYDAVCDTVHKCTESIDRMLADGIVPDYILWHQGESDNIANTSVEDYVKRFESIRKAFRDRGITAPIYIAVASYHPACISDDNGIDKNVRNAQKLLAKKYKDIYLGPDTDKFDRCVYRHDGVHFSSKGLEAHAKAWLKALKVSGVHRQHGN